MNTTLPVDISLDPELGDGDQREAAPAATPSAAPEAATDPLESSASSHWVESVRHAVSTHPLTAVAAAFAVGALVNRLRR